MREPMSHFGLLCPPVAGHLNPMGSLGLELQSRGHRATFLTVPDAKASVEAVRLGVRLVGEDEYPLGEIGRITQQLGQLSGRAAHRFTTQQLKRGEQMWFRELPNAVREEKVDALIVDEITRAGGSVADKLGLPFVTVSNAIVMVQDSCVPPWITSWRYGGWWWSRVRNQFGYAVLNRVTKPIIEIVNEYRTRWNLPRFSLLDECNSTLAHISQQPIEFDFQRTATPRCLHYTGLLNHPEGRPAIAIPWEKLTDRPLVYSSMGTLQNWQVEIFHCIAEACSSLDVQLVLSLGGSRLDLPLLPGAPLAVQRAPQLELLKRASLTITHAGLNTTLESLSHGLPLVAIPITNDQPAVGARIQWAGVGVVVPLGRLNAARLRSAILRVLNGASFRNRAREFGAVIRQAGGVSRAADIVEQVLSTGDPVPA